MSETKVSAPDPDDEDQSQPEQPTPVDDKHAAVRAMLERHLPNLKGVSIEFAGTFDGAAGPYLPTTPKPAPEAEEGSKEPIKLYGMDRIEDMSDADLIDEILVHQRDYLEKQDRYMLTNMIVRSRLSAYAERLINEAGGYGHGIHIHIAD